MRFNQAAAAVWDESATAGSLTPKLSLFLLPSGSKKGVLHPGPSSTPPLKSLDVSVPFKWEEAPGKPRPRRQLLIDYEFVSDSNGGATEEADQSISTTIRKALKLPPRLVNSNNRRVSNIPSPTDGHNYRPPSPPPVERRSSFTNGSARRVGFGSKRWGNLMTLGREAKEDDEVVNFENGVSSVERSYCVDDDDDQKINGAKIIRMRRRSRSLFNLCAQSRLANMYRSLKQVVIPSRRKE